jgi:hypothetical protein
MTFRIRDEGSGVRAQKLGFGHAVFEAGREMPDVKLSFHPSLALAGVVSLNV